MNIKVNSDIIRSGHIGANLKFLIENQGLTITDIAKKMGVTQPAVSRVLNGKVGGSDAFFIKVAKAIGLGNNAIENLFKKADKYAFEYKYGEEISPNCDDIDFEVALKKEFGKEMDADTISKIKDFIKFVNQNEK